MKKVLVVDDPADDIELLRFNLENDGFEVITASSGLECLRLTPLIWPDIILLDIHMPDIDGITTLSRLKTNQITADIPVIIVSAHDGNASIVQSLDIGAHDFVRKPIEYSILAARMRSAMKLMETQQKLEHANKELERIATQDPLTGINNRRNFFLLAEVEFAKNKRHEHELSFLMLDADNFKQINDVHGHAAGDMALRHLADTCKNICRDTDIIGRIGGEEFAICCPQTELDGAHRLAERIRIACENAQLESEKGPFAFTISIGVTSASSNDADINSSLSRADVLLYQAKNTGRNNSVAQAAQGTH